MGNVTIKDVAKLAGVSTATVSRAINSPDKVKPDTVEHVMSVINQTNYIHNSVASTLKSSRSKTIGFIISNICNSHFAYMAREIERTLIAEGYSLIICNTGDDPNLEKSHIQRLLALQVDGIIINTTSQNNEFIDNISQKLPVVLVSRRTTLNFHGDYIGSNNEEGIKLLTRHLINLGHRDIGIITADLTFSTGRERLTGFANAMSEIGVDIREHYPYLYTGNYFNELGGIEGCRYFFSLSRRPTALVIANNSMALGAMKYLREQNISVPDTLSIASFGNIDNSELFIHEPTIVTLSPVYIGQKAAECLLSRLDNIAIPNREIIYEPNFIAGETTASLY